MTLWLKLEVDFTEHPKTFEAGHEAAWVLLRMMSWAKRHAPTGRVPKSADFGRLQTPQNLKRLVSVGYLHDDGDYWQIHQFAEHQGPPPSSSARAAAGRRGAERRWAGAMPVAIAPDGKPDGNCHRSALAGATTELPPLLSAADGQSQGKPIAGAMAVAIGLPSSESESEPRSLPDPDLLLPPVVAGCDRPRAKAAGQISLENWQSDEGLAGLSKAHRASLVAFLGQVSDTERYRALEALRGASREAVGRAAEAVRKAPRITRPLGFLNTVLREPAPTPVNGGGGMTPAAPHDAFVDGRGFEALEEAANG